jgi:hypothetical protein
MQRADNGTDHEAGRLRAEPQLATAIGKPGRAVERLHAGMAEIRRMVLRFDHIMRQLRLRIAVITENEASFLRNVPPEICGDGIARQPRGGVSERQRQVIDHALRSPVAVRHHGDRALVHLDDTLDALIGDLCGVCHELPGQGRRRPDRGIKHLAMSDVDS